MEPRVQIGYSRIAEVWAIYFVPRAARPNGEYADVEREVLGPPNAWVLWLLSDDEGAISYGSDGIAGNQCVFCAWSMLDDPDECPGLRQHALMQANREQTRWPDEHVEMGVFRMPAYLSAQGRLDEVIAQIRQRKQEQARERKAAADGNGPTGRN